jgi:hypothetical protein
MTSMVAERFCGGEIVTKSIRCLFVAGLLLLAAYSSMAVPNEPAFKVLAFYSTNVEPDHVHVANDALVFFKALVAKDNFVFDATTDWDKLNARDLKPYGDYLAERLSAHPRTAQRVPELHGAWRRVARHTRRGIQR